VIETATNSEFATIPLGEDEPFDIAFSPSGGTAYVSLPDSSTLAIIDTTTGRVTDSIPVGVDPAGIAVSADGGLVYVTDFTAGATDAGFAVIDTTTKKVIATAPTLGDGPTEVELTTPPSGLCVGDSEGQTKVTIDELILSVNYALNGCPGRFPSQSSFAP
jgi:YVTN family beta-propeller protein